jgi:hypothetical protein
MQAQLCLLDTSGQCLGSSGQAHFAINGGARSRAGLVTGMADKLFQFSSGSRGCSISDPTAIVLAATMPSKAFRCR